MSFKESTSSLKGIIKRFRLRISLLNPKIRPFKANAELLKAKLKILRFKLIPWSKILIGKKKFRLKFRMTTKRKLKDSKTRSKTTKTSKPIFSVTSRTPKSKFPDFRQNWKTLTIVYRARPESIRPA